MEDLPLEMIDEIFVRLDLSAVPYFSEASHICRSISLKRFTPITSRHVLKRVCNKGDLFSLMVFKNWNTALLNIGFCQSALRGHDKLVNWFIKKGATAIGMAVANACRGGHLKIAKALYNKEYGTVVCVKIFLSWRGKVNHTVYSPRVYRGCFDNALVGACRGEHFEVIDWLINNFFLARYEYDPLVRYANRQPRLGKWLFRKYYPQS